MMLKNKEHLEADHDEGVHNFTNFTTLERQMESLSTKGKEKHILNFDVNGSGSIMLSQMKSLTKGRILDFVVNVRGEEDINCQVLMSN